MNGVEAFCMLAVSVLIVWGIVASLRWVFGWIFGGNSAPEIPPDEWQQAVQVISRPQRMPDGRWMQAELTWKPCDAPVASNNLEVHDRNAPGHDAKTCPHCKPAKGYSGVSYRPTN
jgi:hypothetical protein